MIFYPEDEKRERPVPPVPRDQPGYRDGVAAPETLVPLALPAPPALVALAAQLARTAQLGPLAPPERTATTGPLVPSVPPGQMVMRGRPAPGKVA